MTDITSMSMDNHITGSYGQCASCGEATSWVEVNFETHLCPGVCTDNLWRHYWIAVSGVATAATPSSPSDT